MATGGERKLTASQIACLAAAISQPNMESIALQFLDLEPDMDNLKYKYKGNVEAINRDILIQWRNKNYGPDEVPVRFQVLFSAPELIFALLCDTEQLMVAPMRFQMIFSDPERDFCPPSSCVTQGN